MVAINFSYYLSNKYSLSSYYVLGLVAGTEREWGAEQVGSWPSGACSVGGGWESRILQLEQVPGPGAVPEHLTWAERTHRGFSGEVMLERSLE